MSEKTKDDITTIRCDSVKVVPALSGRPLLVLLAGVDWKTVEPIPSSTQTCRACALRAVMADELPPKPSPAPTLCSDCGHWGIGTPAPACAYKAASGGACALWIPADDSCSTRKIIWQYELCCRTCKTLWECDVASHEIEEGCSNWQQMETEEKVSRLDETCGNCGEECKTIDDPADPACDEWRPKDESPPPPKPSIEDGKNCWMCKHKSFAGWHVGCPHEWEQRNSCDSWEPKDESQPKPTPEKLKIRLSTDCVAYSTCVKDSCVGCEDWRKEAGLNAWQIWVDAWRSMHGRGSDPKPTVPAVAAAKNIAKHFQTYDELHDVFVAYLYDKDSWLASKDHSITLLPQRIDVYRQKPDPAFNKARSTMCRVCKYLRRCEKTDIGCGKWELAGGSPPKPLPKTAMRVSGCRSCKNVWDCGRADIMDDNPDGGCDKWEAKEPNDE